jgi:hypothetical protein
MGLALVKNNIEFTKSVHKLNANSKVKDPKDYVQLWGFSSATHVDFTQGMKGVGKGGVQTYYLL